MAASCTTGGDSEPREELFVRGSCDSITAMVLRDNNDGGRESLSGGFAVMVDRDTCSREEGEDVGDAEDEEPWDGRSRAAVISVAMASLFGNGDDDGDGNDDDDEGGGGAVPEERRCKGALSGAVSTRVMPGGSTFFTQLESSGSPLPSAPSSSSCRPCTKAEGRPSPPEAAGMVGAVVGVLSWYSESTL